VKPGDRVLLLTMPATPDLLALSKKLTHGLVAAIVSEDDVYEGRRMARDCDNVMFTAWDGDIIPWRDDFFTIVYAPASVEPTPEIWRVLALGGVLISGSEPRPKGAVKF
jgi:hypothetical protein